MKIIDKARRRLVEIMRVFIRNHRAVFVFYQIMIVGVRIRRRLSFSNVSEKKLVYFL
jgi:hypothetical protein